MKELINELNALFNTDKFNTKNVSNLSRGQYQLPIGIKLPAFCSILFPVKKKSG